MAFLNAASFPRFLHLVIPDLIRDPASSVQQRQGISKYIGRKSSGNPDHTIHQSSTLIGALSGLMATRGLIYQVSEQGRLKTHLAAFSVVFYVPQCKDEKYVVPCISNIGYRFRQIVFRFLLSKRQPISAVVMNNFDS